MIWVFKTSVENTSQVVRLQSALDNLILPEGCWNFDLEDCDRILRVEANSLSVYELTGLMRGEGFLCEELMD